MKLLKFLVILFMFTPLNTVAQKTNTIDSLRKAIDNYQRNDTVKIKMLFDYAFLMFQSDLKKTKVDIQRAIQIAATINQPEFVLRGNLYLSYCYGTENRNDSSVMVLLDGLNLSERYHLDKYLSQFYQLLGENYRMLNNDKLAEYYDNKFLGIATAQKNKAMTLEALVSFVTLYDDNGQDVKLVEFLNRTLPMAISQKNESLTGRLLTIQGDEFYRQEKPQQAINNYHNSMIIWRNERDNAGMAYTLVLMSKSFLLMNQKDSASWYAYAALDTAKKYQLKKETGDAYQALFKFHEHYGNYKMALEEKLIIDSLQNEGTNGQTGQSTLRAELKYEQEKKDLLASIEQEKKEADARRIRNLTYGTISAFILLAAFLLYNNRQKQRSKIKIEKAYSELKNTQAQLIQSEKMASLGELTAGIAHEIQNPLNFVNNFSELNAELLEETSTAVGNGKSEEALELVTALIENEKKISYHGKRADAIVKGMLEHSRSGKGIKTPTDINALADEYLKLSYHGLRVRDNILNATMKTEFDPAIGSVQIVPQDIGRVLLNLYNNAFYSVMEKKKKLEEGYQPTISVSTKRTDNKISIRVKDNGNGIPPKLIDKIFQPFFTTKPTGQGTGLGLSLSYDIVKAHGGAITVNTVEGEFTEFLIQLPA